MLENDEIIKCQQTGKIIKKLIIEIAYKTSAHHIGSCLSCVDLLTVLYFNILKIEPQNPKSPDRDWFILSKGHAALALYVVLAVRGFFPQEILSTFAQDGSRLGVHPDKDCVPGVEMSTGSLGHGLSVAAGVALAAKRDKLPNRVFVLIGDGECNEGIIWETALFAAHHQLDNLVTIIDYNRWQAFGTTDEVLKLDPLDKKWEAFGWSVREINGHNLTDIVDAFNKVPLEGGRPSLIIANTIKGKGISFMENTLESHYICLNEQQCLQALKELES